MLDLAACSALMLAPGLLGAQSLSRLIRDGHSDRVAFTFAPRPGTCGNGRNYLEDGFGGSQIEDANFSGYSRHSMQRECARGPVRVVATLIDGEVTRLRTHVGPPARSDDVRELGDVSVREATDYLRSLFEASDGRLASDAMFAYTLADSTTPWPALLRVARNEDRPKSVRQNATIWLSRGAAYKLGATSDESPDDEVRSAAVFAVYNHDREHAVPQLLEIVRTSKRPAVRASALFWLGQTGDPRGLALMEEILR